MLGLAACGAPQATSSKPAKLRLVIATGGTGGVYYPFGGGLARVLSAKLPNADATAELTGGSVDNMKLVQAGEADLGLSTLDSAFDATRGIGSYADTGPVPARTLAVVYKSFVHVVTLEGTGIRKVADMRGKRISVGSAGSSTEAAADRILEAAGLDPRRDIRRDNLSVAESASAMKDEKVDAFFWIGGMPTAAVTDLATTPGRRIAFVPTSEFIEPMRAKSGPVYDPALLPKGTYSGQDADVPGIGVDNILFVNASMADAQVTALLTALFDNLEDVRKSHPEAAGLTLAGAAHRSPVPFHPAAVRYYEEKGVWPK